MKVAIVLIALAAAVSCASSSTTDKKWNSYKVRFAKSYEQPEEEAMRKALFVKTDEVIKRHNNEGHSWTLRHNEFSDMTDTEFSELIGKGQLDSETDSTSITYEPIQDRQVPPRALDLRREKCLGPVKNQGRCMSSYAFAAMAVLEYASCMTKNKTYVPFSEQQLVDCDYGSNGCTAGTVETSLKYLTGAGAVPSKSYAYTGRVKACNLCGLKPEARPNKIKYATKQDKPNAADVAAALVKYGPLATQIKINGPEWKTIANFATGIFDPKDIKCVTGDAHAVVIVGYGNDPRLRKDFWIVRNSWGAGWGDKGYFRIRRGVDVCGMEKRAVYVTV